MRLGAAMLLGAATLLSACAEQTGGYAPTNAAGSYYPYDGYSAPAYPGSPDGGISMKFNHVANRVDPDYFETVVAMLKVKLDFVELRRTERSIWLRQPGANVDLQFSRSETANRDADKLRSQVSFLSETPRADLEDLAAWAKTHGMETRLGSYSDREFYLDAPGAFVDFVIEAMLPELADYPQ